MNGIRSLAALIIPTLLVAAGCDKKITIDIPYDYPAEYSIPRKVHRLAITEFGAMSRTDKRWGEVAADKLASALDEYNKRFKRYVLVDRKRLSAVLAERDTQLMVSDTSTAVKFGKIAKVDAMIYGNVNVIAKDESATRSTFDPLRRRMKRVSYKKRYCLVAVNFTMADIHTSKTIATVTVTREYDSEKDKKAGGSFASKLGFGGDRLPPTDHVINGLIQECIEEILRKISPHTRMISVKLQGGRSKYARTGNKLAASGEYADALELYERAIDKKGDDHGAIFNAGVMCEALRKYAKALEYYNRAYRLEPKEEYIRARKRVRDLQKKMAKRV